MPRIRIGIPIRMWDTISGETAQPMSLLPMKARRKPASSGAAVAKQHGRRFLGVELSEKVADMARATLEAVTGSAGSPGSWHCGADPLQGCEQAAAPDRARD